MSLTLLEDLKNKRKKDLKIDVWHIHINTVNQFYVMFHLSNNFSEYVPRWYLTSPEPNPSSAIGLNWVNSWLIGFEHTFTKVLRRPRCAIPMTTVSTPSKHIIHENSWISNKLQFHLPWLRFNNLFQSPFNADVSIHSVIAGINDSQPSKPNLFSVPYFFARKFSKFTALMIFIQIHFRCSAGNSQAPGISNFSLNQSNW